MSTEFIETKNIREVERYINNIESSPEWKNVLLLRESIKRLTLIRGRLVGEKSQDKKDLYYDVNSFMGFGLSSQEINNVLGTMVTVEASYYHYAENYAAWCACDSGYPERIPDYKDVAKEMIAWAIWYRWEPVVGISPNGLHRKVLCSLKHLPLMVHKSYLSNLPTSNFYAEMEDLGEKVDFSEKIREMPEYRLRRRLGNFSLEEIFVRLDALPVRERLPILCVMGYIPDVKNISQGIELFGIETETFRNDFDRGLNLISDIYPSENSSRSAREIVEESIKIGLIRDPNGNVAFYDSPRVALIDLKCNGKLTGINEKIFNMAKELDGRTFRFSLEEIGREFGLSKTAVAKRIRRICDTLEKINT